MGSDSQTVSRSRVQERFSLRSGFSSSTPDVDVALSHAGTENGPPELLPLNQKHSVSKMAFNSVALRLA